jgi:hypothetical protein
MVYDLLEEAEVGVPLITPVVPSKLRPATKVGLMKA